nr:pilus assembly protein FimV [Burkholderiales bacterium]
MRTSKLIGALIAGSVICLASAYSFAAGLGRLTVQSALGQPLQAEIELLSVQKGEADSLAARIASQEAFREAKVDYSPILNAIRFSVEKRPNGEPYLRLTTSQPVEEPFIDMLVELSWASGRLVREFPLLLDPPGFAAKQAAPAVAARTPAPPIASPTPAVKPVEPENTARPATPAAPAAAAEPAAAAGETSTADSYKVKSGDTLYRIANEMKPGNVDLDRMVVALFRENRQAFMGNNMNRLKSGAILKLPTAEQANNISPKEATRDIRVQVADWNAYRNNLAGQAADAPTRPDTASQSTAGKIGQASVDKPAAPSAGPKDVLKLSKGAEGKAAADKGADARVNALREELITRENQVKEEKARVAELEKNIQSMQRLLEMKSQALADMQKQAEAGKAASTSPPPSKAAETKAAAEKPLEAKPADVKTAEVKPAAESKTAEPTPAPVTPAEAPAKSAQPADAKVAEAKPKAPPKQAPSVVTPAEPEQSLLDGLLENPLLPIAGGFVVLLAGFLGYSAYRRRRVLAPTTTEAATTGALVTDLKSGAPPNAKASGVVDTGNSSFLTDFEKTGPGIIDIEEVDPVAEAEVYIAYGRDAQAEEILKEAMVKDSSRHEIPLKLLEIYSARK